MRKALINQNILNIVREVRTQNPKNVAKSRSSADLTPKITVA